MLTQGKTSKVLIAAPAGAGGIHSRGERAARLRHQARKGDFESVEMAVLVLDKQKKPLMPCSEKRARRLLERGRAVVVRLAPFIIRLKDRIGGSLQPLRLKLDPGSKTTGLALVRESESVHQCAIAPRAS